jgi:hypothetical protein
MGRLWRCQRIRFHLLAPTPVATNNDNQNLSLEERFVQLEAQLKKVTEESEAKDSIIETQGEQLVAAQAQGEGQLSVVIHDKQSYQVLAGQFSLDDEVIKHHELKGKPELVKKLVEEKSPLLKLLPKKEEKAAKK